MLLEQAASLYYITVCTVCAVLPPCTACTAVSSQDEEYELELRAYQQRYEALSAQYEARQAKLEAAARARKKEKELAAQVRWRHRYKHTRFQEPTPLSMIGSCSSSWHQRCVACALHFLGILVVLVR